MSGLEIAGLVLGGIPIIYNCLKMYREEFEKVDGWWQFNNQFTEFLDGVRHEMLEYQQIMEDLLRPIEPDENVCRQLAADPNDERWKDEIYAREVDVRLAGEKDRFFRTVQKIQTTVAELKESLGIDEDGQIKWLAPQSSGASWSWSRHMYRLKHSFSKSKVRRLAKISKCNETLKKILGQCNRMIATSGTGEQVPPEVSLFEKIRMSGIGIYDALKRHIRCSTGKCESHRVCLCVQVNPEASQLQFLFLFKEEQQDVVHRQHLTIEPTGQTLKDTAPKPRPPGRSQQVQFGSDFRTAQMQFQLVNNPTSPTARPTSQDPQIALATAASTTSTFNSATKLIGASGRTVSFQTATSHQRLHEKPITDVCNLILNCPDDHELGTIMDDYNRVFKLAKSNRAPTVTDPTNAPSLIPFPEFINSLGRSRKPLGREKRFAMAAHVSAIFLQLHASPWLPRKWTRQDIYYLASGTTLYSDFPYLSKVFNQDSEGKTLIVQDNAYEQMDAAELEEATRDSLITLGIILTELILGRNFCDDSEADFKTARVHGSTTAPSDLVAKNGRRWEREVEKNAGPVFSDVVRRCFHCAFGAKPDFKFQKFRQDVYEGVVRPLEEFSTGTWPEYFL